MTIHDNQSARQRLPRLMREFGESNATLACYLALLVVVALLVSRDARIWSLVLPPVLGPFAAAIYLWISPLNPYKISAHGVDNDAMAQRLITLLRSKEAKRHSLRTALVMSPLLTGCTLLMARVQKPIAFSFDRSQDFQLIIGGIFVLGLGCLAVEMCFLLRWAFPRWDAEDSRGSLANPHKQTPTA